MTTNVMTEWKCTSCLNGQESPCVLTFRGADFVPKACPFYDGVAKQCDPVQWERVEGLTTPPSLKEEDKPVCFKYYGYRICVERNKLPSICKWENRCYNSQRDY